MLPVLRYKYEKSDEKHFGAGELTSPLHISRNIMIVAA